MVAVPVRLASVPAVSDDVVQNYLALTNPSRNPETIVPVPASPVVTTPIAHNAAKTAISTPLPSHKKPLLQTSVSPMIAAPQRVSHAVMPTAESPSKTIVLPSRVATVLPSSATPRRDPAILSSRHKDRILLAQLEADLMRADRGLDRANDTLSRGQKQLLSVGATLRTAMLNAGPDAKGLNPFVRVAMRYAGTPYVWGGESRNGFDCSGFIIVVMRDLGYRALPHSAAEQFNYGTPIAQELLKPGDIVFFKNTYKAGVSHVGIYLGRRRFINAAGTGKGTIVSSLDDPFWVEHYAGARRLIAG